MVPPNFLWTLTSLKSTLNDSWLGKTLSTASTARGDKISLLAATTFEDKEVLTHSIKLYLSVNLTSVCNDVIISNDFLRALIKPSEIVVGWIPFSNKISQEWSKEPAKTATEVVPSPASISYAFEISTNIFAVGWTTSIYFKIVAPSFVINTFPLLF